MQLIPATSIDSNPNKAFIVYMRISSISGSNHQKGIKNNHYKISFKKSAPNLGGCSTNFGIILTMKKILFFPGAFNPPHNGHISLVQTALNQFTFDEVWIMPSGRRDDGKIISTNYEQKNSNNALCLFVANLICFCTRYLFLWL